MFGWLRILVGGGVSALNNRGKNKTERLKVKAQGIIGLVNASSNAALGIIALFCAGGFLGGYAWMEKEGWIDAGLISQKEKLISAGLIFLIVFLGRTVSKTFRRVDDD